MAILDGQSTTLRFNGQLVGKVTQYNVIDGVTPAVPFKPMDGSGNFARPGVPQFGQVNVTLYRDMTDVGQIEMELARAGSLIADCVITLEDHTTRSFPGFVTVLPMVGSGNGISPAQAVIKVAGPVT